MRVKNSIGLPDVQAVYSGAEGDLWELVMGEQIHIGGFVSSMDLARRAGISAGSRGVDLCCCNGAGMRFLLRYGGVEHMTGVDATPEVIRRGEERCRAQGFAGKTRFVRADVCATGLPSGTADFVWGEDAWCYVANKQALIAEAVRLARPGGTLAFTDWVEGAVPLTAAEADRLLAFMKFPSLASIPDYRGLLASHGCSIAIAEDTGRFPPYVDLYLNMLTQQLTGDALRIIGFDMKLFEAMGAEMQFMQELAHAGKIAQAIFVARRNG